MGRGKFYYAGQFFCYDASALNLAPDLENPWHVLHDDGRLYARCPNEEEARVTVRRLALEVKAGRNPQPFQ